MALLRQRLLEVRVKRAEGEAADMFRIDEPLLCEESWPVEPNCQRQRFGPPPLALTEDKLMPWKIPSG